MRIEACFDSHVHWAATGEFAAKLRLESLSSPALVEQLQIEKHHQRGEWLTGFGWDENKWSEKPHRRFLDQKFGAQPVAFSRCDAHALWVNTEALQRAGLWTQSSDKATDGRIERDAEGWPTGVLVDRAAEPVEKLIPKPQAFDLRRHLLKATQVFNEAGYTHIRDMTCDEAQWHEAVKLDESGLLTLAVEEYFWLPETAGLSATLELALRARSTQTANLRVKGLKMFLDGALGSEGAWLSRCYHGSQRSGLQLWDKAALSEAIARCWENGLEPAVHAIGDEAAAFLVDCALALKTSGREGRLHIEHAELLRPETINKMRELNIECHMQPGHWLSDQVWLKDKIGGLVDCAFPWRRLQEADISFDFGSDAPIEPPGLARVFKALEASAESGIPRLLGLPATYMSHRDLSWAPNSFTLLAEKSPRQVVFRGEHIL